ncbi:alpha/beta fold hydrolase [Falsiroseomonas oryzae]|uniref:alpha/beta fold hydrolase n=1 Tax=Falsiroseomonas oryzae TaxID=2766473 RepID=UPI0022EBA2F8|nr:alpha/beta hydrolase [Roseomonas sp. MO-31]
MSFAAPPCRAGFVERPDCRIAYEVTGTGPAIVFAHGLGGNLLSWWQQVAHFATRYTCVAFSHRGFFPSTSPTPVPDPTLFAADLAALVDELGLGEIRFVGQSMGGWTGVEYALMRPGRVKALVLAATTGTLDPRRLPPPIPAPDRNAAQADLLARNITPATGERMAKDQPALYHLYNHIGALNGGLDRVAMRAAIDAMRTRPPADLAAARCPVLFVECGEDVSLDVPGAAMAAAIPGARAALLPTAGHSGHFEQAAAFNAIVERFFEEVGA